MRTALQNFTGGEIAPTLSARYDLARYRNCLSCMENMLPGLHGDAARRPGTRFVADLGGYSVLIPFSFSALASQNFVLVLGDHSLRIASERGLEDIASITTPRWGTSCTSPTAITPCTRWCAGMRTAVLAPVLAPVPVPILAQTPGVQAPLAGMPHTPGNWRQWRSIRPSSRRPRPR